MDSRISDYLANAARVSALVESVPPERWEAPSPCAGWIAADVVQHVIDTQLRQLLADESFATAPYDGYFGPTTVADTIRDFYGWDLVGHRWDLGRAVGREILWTEAECLFVGGELEGFGDQLYSEGICKPAVEAPAEADEQTRVLALLGRRAWAWTPTSAA